MKCRNCGADNPSGAETCGYCGSQIASAEDLSRQRMFALIKESPEYAARNTPERLAKLPKIGAIHKAFLVIFFVIFIGGSSVICVVALGMAGVFGFLGFRGGGGIGVGITLVPLVFGLMPLGFVVLGIFLFQKARKRMNAMERDPTEALPVVVIDKRTEVSGGSGDSSATTRYYATCEDEKGARTEYLLWDGRLYGRIVAEDAGILYVRAGCALDFDPIRSASDGR